jgi:hypothetical protein
VIHSTTGDRASRALKLIAFIAPPLIDNPHLSYEAPTIPSLGLAGWARQYLSFCKHTRLTRPDVHAHVDQAAADSKQYLNHVHRRSSLMIVELGKVTETTQDTASGSFVDFTHQYD